MESREDMATAAVAGPQGLSLEMNTCFFSFDSHGHFGPFAELFVIVEANNFI